jgi:hypothetical protein
MQVLQSPSEVFAVCEMVAFDVTRGMKQGEESKNLHNCGLEKQEEKKDSKSFFRFCKNLTFLLLKSVFGGNEGVFENFFRDS